MQRFFGPSLLIALTLLAGPRVSAAGDATGVLPLWVDASQAASVWIETRFPPAEEFPLTVSPESRFLIIRLEAAGLDDPAPAAFELKNLVVEARSAAPELKVALDGPSDQVARLVDQGLAPYLDAYVTRDEGTLPGLARPASDPTARAWRRSNPRPGDVLAELLAASSRDVELVVLEGLTLTAAHRELLEKLATLRATDLAPQPAVSGIAQRRVRFFLDPDTGHHYLAVDAEAGAPQRIFFTLGEEVAAAHGLYPTPTDHYFYPHGRRGELVLPGRHSSHYLFELTSSATETPHWRLVVEDTEIVDPYEIVVKNQVFQKKQAEKVTNLLVNERVYTLAQRPRSRPITREYRVVHRNGQPTDYIFTGLAVNGVPYPKNKLRQGFVFDADQVLVDPLAIELDRTYEYTYLGSELLAGHPTWKIGFRPTREGAYLAGTVWIDQRTHAHRRLQARQGGTLEPVVNREFTVTYDWIEQDGEHYWTWTHNQGTAILSYLGFHQPVHVVIDRSGHRFNSESADREIETAYFSDAKMLRQTPEGLRWLTRRKVRNRGGSTRHLDRERDSDVQTGAYERVLADRNFTSHNRRIGLLYVYDSSFGDSNPYTDVDFSFFDLAFRGSKLQVYLLAQDNSFLSLAYSGIGRKNWVLSLDLELPTEFYDRELGRPTEELEFEQSSAVLALAMPLRPALSVYARYRWSDVAFSALGGTDEAFVPPSDHVEHSARVEVKLDRRGFSSELVLEYGQRSDWQPWGLPPLAGGGAEPLESSFFKGALKGGYYRQLSRNQSVGVYASYLNGSGLDRFSRIRLGFGGFRVAGYSRLVRFDEGFGVNFNYSGHFLKLFPLQLRLDWATIQPNNDLGLDSEYFAGVELVTTLHGPWKTDLFLSFGRGIATSLDDAEDEGTRFIASLSRRF